MSIANKLIAAAEKEKIIRQKLTAIADTIRNYVPHIKDVFGKNTLNLDDMPEGINQVYMAGNEYGHSQGFNSGYAFGYSEGEEDGKQAEWNAFWDSFQENGNRYNYNNAFCGTGWTDITFKPKYDIRVSNTGNTATNIFQGSRITDLAKILEEQGVVIDLSQYNGSNTLALFHSCTQMTRIPVINIAPTANFGWHFYNCPKLHTIEGFVLSEEGTQTFDNNMFNYSKAIENITIYGKIGNDFNISYTSVLTKASITSIINALLDTAEGKTVTFSKTAVDKAFETTNGANDGSTSNEWIALITPKSNAYNGKWTISLV